MLHIRIHRLELARHRIERDLKRIAIQQSRALTEGDRAARASGSQITTTNDISRRNEMTPQIGDTPPIANQNSTTSQDQSTKNTVRTSQLPAQCRSAS